MELKLTEQQLQVINYLSGRDRVALQELAQFAKDPQQIKLKTVQKMVSEIRKKYKAVGLPMPFTCSLYKAEVVVPSTVVPQMGEMMVRQVETPVIPPPSQKLVKLPAMRTTLGGNKVLADDNTPDAHIDFKLDRFYDPKRVRTKMGIVNLNDNDFQLFEIFHQNVGKQLSKEDLKNLVFPQAGSKLKSSWWGDISGRMTSLRTSLPELKSQNRLLTIQGGSTTFYMFK